MKKKKSKKSKKVIAKKTVKKKPAKKSAASKKVKAKKSVKKGKSVKKSAKGSKPATVNIPKPTYIPAAGEVLLGEVEDYFGHIGVIALTIKESLSIGDTIHVHGHTTDLTQKAESMQINHVAVQSAKKGDSVGIKANDKCRKGDKVFRVG